MDSAASVGETDDALPYPEKDDTHSRATIEETQAQNMTRSLSPVATMERRSQDYNYASSLAVNLLNKTIDPFLYISQNRGVILFDVTRS